jgi:hypothetical protein
MRIFTLIYSALLLLLIQTAVAQPMLNLKRSIVQWPDVHVYYDITCGGQFEFSHNASNFSLFEDGVPIQNFSVYCPDTTQHCPPSVALVLDASASMVGKWHAAIIKAGNVFVDKMDGSTDEAAVLYFNSVVTVQQGMTTQRASLKSAINSMFPQGGNLLFDGIYAGITEVVNNGSNSCRAVVVATDGSDNLSTATEANIIALARLNSVPIITLGLGSFFDGPLLQRLADSTGGHFFPVLDTLNASKNFREVFEFISDGFRECELTYQADCADGAAHDLRMDIAGVCGGTDSRTLQLHKPLLPSTNLILDLLPGVTEAFAGQPVTVPVAYTMLQPGVLQPSSIVIRFPMADLQLTAVSIPAGSPLSGSGVDIIPYAGNYLLSTRDAVALGIGGSFVNLEFDVVDRNDSTTLPISPVSSQTGKGCVSPVFHPGSINVAIPPRPLIEAVGKTAFCPGDSVLLRVTSEFDAYSWTTGDTSRMIVARDSGNYAVSVVDHAGRTAISPLFHVEVHPGAQPTLSSQGMFSLCAGRTFDLQTTAPFSSYLWSTGDTTAVIRIADAGVYSVHVVDSNGCEGRSDTLYVTLDDPVVHIQPADTVLLCEGGSTVLTADAGFAQYRWSNGRSGQALTVTQPGRFAVMVTNAAGCTATSDTVVVVQAARPTASITAVGPMTVCPGDSLLLDGQTGFAAYEWSTGESTQTIHVDGPGTYWLRVTAPNGCVSIADSVEVGVTQRPALTPSGTQALCHGENLTIDAGAGYVQYLWSTGEQTRSITVDTSGRFWADVLDAGGCLLRSDTTEVFFRPEIRPEITAEGPTSFCEGDSVVLAAPLGYASYRWTSGETVSRIVAHTSGNYSVEVFTSDGCQGRSDDVVVTAVPYPAKPVITSSGNRLTCTPAPLYQWYRDGALMPGEVAQTLDATIAGRYHVVVSTPEGCSNTSDPFDFVYTSVHVLPADFTVNAYPDPNRGILHVSVQLSKPSALRIVVVNMLGQQVAEQRDDHVQGNVLRRLDLTRAAAGTYQLRVQTDDGIVTRQIVRL